MHLLLVSVQNGISRCVLRLVSGVANVTGVIIHLGWPCPLSS